MRELTVRIRFTSPSLGNVKQRNTRNLNRYRMPFSSGKITFLGAWHLSNMLTAAKLSNKHHKVVRDILWDIFVDGHLPRGQTKWHRRYYNAENGGRRFADHQCFPEGHIIGLNCAVPSDITDDDMLQLMATAGRYCGLSPWKPKEFGRFEVDSIRLRRSRLPEAIIEKADEVLNQNNES